MRRLIPLLLVLALLTTALPTLAQGGGTSLPQTYQMSSFRHEYQGWNNCGPATLTMALAITAGRTISYAAKWLKPEPRTRTSARGRWSLCQRDDPGARPAALRRDARPAAHVHRQRLPGDNRGRIRAGRRRLDGALPAGDGLRSARPNLPDPELVPWSRSRYGATEIDAHWQHFNRVFIVVYDPAREADLRPCSVRTPTSRNAARALATARQEAVGDSSNPFAWSTWVPATSPWACRRGGGGLRPGAQYRRWAAVAHAVVPVRPVRGLLSDRPL